jgi:N-acetylglucosamine malate deacetylase 1
LEILVIAAHPDDEVLGMGGTIRKLADKKNSIHLCIVTDGASAQYQDKNMIKIRKESCKKSGKILGISTYNFLNFPDMKLDTIPHLEINRKIEKIIQKYNPEIVYTTPASDFNKDHKIVNESTVIATRTTSSNVKKLFSYELPGPKKSFFQSNLYEDITKQFSLKIDAFKKYKSEIKKFPHPRSIESIENMAIQRGIESGLKKAEAFNILRIISK